MSETSRWVRIKEILSEVLEMPGAERDTCIQSMCGDDTDLRREVEAFLHAGNDNEHLFKRPLFSLLDYSVDPPIIPNHEILALLGEGGMGEVYKARATKSLAREVAVKVIRRGLDLPRFNAEIDLLARMKHSNIATVFESGVTKTGRPYFSMELVEGSPITGFCDYHGLSIVQRLNLFLSVCAGVEHAHLKGIIHRDLKPSNILVREEGQRHVPKIIDFGVAKALSPHLVAGDATHAGDWIGTPPYMSREQVIDPREVDVRTDVYGLGATLYVMLVGQPPFDAERLRTVDQLEQRRIIAEEEPKRPSVLFGDFAMDEKRAIASARGISDHRLFKVLRGDIGWIVMKALEKNPDRRYRNVAELADDVKRFLEGSPVSARAPNTLYSLRKFVARHRAAVIAAVVVGVAVISAFVSISGALKRAETAQQEAVRQGEKATTQAASARATSDFLISLFEVADPNERAGQALTAREILEEGTRRVEQELRDQPEIRGDILRTLGVIHDRLGSYSEAERLLRHSLQTRMQLSGSSDLSVAEVHNDLGWLFHDQGRLTEAQDFYETGLGVREATLGSSHPLVAESLNNIANVLLDLGQYERADTYSIQAHKIRETHFGIDHLETAEIMNDRGWLLINMGRYDEAKEFLTIALSTRRQHRGEFHRDVGMTLNNLAIIANDTGDVVTALCQYVEVAQIIHDVLGDKHQDFASAMNNIANALEELRYMDRAEQLHRWILTLRTRKLGTKHMHVAQSLSNLAWLEKEDGRWDSAEEHYRDALKVLTVAGGEDHPHIDVVTTYLAEISGHRGDFLECVNRAETAVGRLNQSFGSNHWRVALAENILSHCRARLGQTQGAEKALRASYDLIIATHDENSDYARASRSRIADFYTHIGNPSEAASWQPVARPGVSEHVIPCAVELSETEALFDVK